MKADWVDIEKIEDVLREIPKGTPWFYVLYAYINTVLEDNNGNRTHTSAQIKMPVRTLRYKLYAAEVLGFEIPEYRPKSKGAA
jgi:DNA-binding NtrC family response regulator